MMRADRSFARLFAIGFLVTAVEIAAGSVALAADATKPADEASAVRAVGQAWIAAYAAGNYAAIPELYTEDTMVMPRGRPRIVGREQMRRSVGGLAAGRKVEIDVVERELVVIGDLAWYVGDFTVTYTAKDADTAPKTEFGRSLIIYKKGADGRWRIHRDIDSPAPPPSQRTAVAAERPQ